MARVLYTAMVSEIIGKVNGMTFQNNRSGNIVRKTGTTGKVKTNKQSLILNRNNTLINEWQGLTLTQQTNWNNFSDLYSKVNRWGQTKQLTGFNWFQHINSNRIITGNSTVTAPPTYASPSGITAFNVSVAAGSLRAVFTSSFDASSLYLLVFASMFKRQLNLSNRGQYRLIKVFDPGVYSSLQIITEYESYYNITIPSAASGSKINISMLIVPVESTSFIGAEGLSNIGSL